MGKPKKELVAEVKPYTCKCRLPACPLHNGKQAFGVTAGRKWHCYVWATPAAAERYRAALYAGPASGVQHVIMVNVGYDEPAAWAKESAT